MPVPVRPDVGEGNLRLLLNEGCESPTLDYKRYCDLSSKPDQVELAKDVAAMQMEGGYIIVGADDHGKPSGWVTQQHLRSFEQATLRNMMLKYLSEPLNILAKHHDLDGNLYVLIHIGPSDDCLSIIKSYGRNAKGEIVFQPGDVFARHGTASERWNQHDISKVNSKIVERQRERWLREASQAFAASLPSAAASSIASGPAHALTWHLDNNTFLEVVIEHLRKPDLIPLKLLLTGIAAEVGPMLAEQGAEERVAVVLDRLTCLAALLLRLDQDDLFRSVVEAFVAIYKLPISSHGGRRDDQAMKPDLLWFMTVQRLIGLGAYAERLENWDAVRFLVLQKGRGYDFEYESHNWYRHALTMAARANLLDFERDEVRVKSSLLHFGLAHVERLACLRPDLPADDEELLNSICRFDMLASIVGIDSAGRRVSGAYYPSFAKFHSRRSEPAVVSLLDIPEMRKALFHGSDEQLAETLAEINRTASGEAHLIHGWDGFRDEKVKQFLERHRPER